MQITLEHGFHEYVESVGRCSGFGGKASRSEEGKGSGKSRRKGGKTSLGGPDRVGGAKEKKLEGMERIERVKSSSIF